MAQRRMFSKEVTNSSDFQMMSPSAQALYLHIGMNADDDGFCEVFTIMRMTESKPDDLRSLHERGLIYLVDSKVGIVTDWHVNNDIRSDRYTRSKYLNDPKYGNIYRTIMQERIQNLARYKDKKDGSTNGITDGSTSGITQVRLGKVRIGNNPAKTTSRKALLRAPGAEGSEAESREEYGFEREMQKLRESSQKHLKIIALYWFRKKWVFDNREQFKKSLKRDMRAASALTGYDSRQINEAITYCDNEYKVWTLETVGKRIDDIINKKND